MSPTIRITSAGGYIPVEPDGRLTVVAHDQVEDVSESQAKRLVGHGVAVLHDPGEPANEIPADFDLSQLTIAQLKRVAQDRGIRIPSTVRSLAGIRGLLETSGDGAPGNGPTVIQAEPLPEGDLPEDLAELTDGQLLSLAIEWELTVPKNADRDALLALVAAYDRGA
jgi:hypothetical protein